MGKIFSVHIDEVIFTHFNSIKFKDSTFSSITGEELSELSSVKHGMQSSLSRERRLLSLADAPLTEILSQEGIRVSIACKTKPKCLIVSLSCSIEPKSNSGQAKRGSNARGKD